MGLKWIEPDIADKTGKCSKRYDAYWNKIADFPGLRSFRDQYPRLMTSGDLVHNWVKGVVTPVKIEGSLDLEEVEELDINNEFEKQRVGEIDKMVKIETERGLEMDEDYIYIAEETGVKKFKQVDGSVVLKTYDDKTMGADVWKHEHIRDRFFRNSTSISDGARI